MNAKSCFICDCTINGKYHQLSSYKLKFSKKELFEKLANLVGDKLVVICHADDVLCQRCVTIMETLDKLESEAASARRLVLRFLDKKYTLENAETESNVEAVEKPVEETPRDSFAEKKRKSQEAVEKLTQEANDDPRNRIWLKCDTCHYTTNYTTFVQRHIHTDNCLTCAGPLTDGVCALRCGVARRNFSQPRKADPLPAEECSPVLPDSFMEENDGLEEVDGDDVPLEVQISLPEDSEGDESDGKYFEVPDGQEGKGLREIFTVSDTGDVESVRVMWHEEGEAAALL